MTTLASMGHIKHLLAVQLVTLALSESDDGNDEGPIQFKALEN